MADVDREPPVRRAAARWQPAATAWLWARVADTPGGLILTIGLAGAADRPLSRWEEARWQLHRLVELAPAPRRDDAKSG